MVFDTLGRIVVYPVQDEADGSTVTGAFFPMRSWCPRHHREGGGRKGAHRFGSRLHRGVDGARVAWSAPIIRWDGDVLKIHAKSDSVPSGARESGSGAPCRRVLAR